MITFYFNGKRVKLKKDGYNRYIGNYKENFFVIFGIDDHNTKRAG